jgi:hypothetical protein
MTGSIGVVLVKYFVLMMAVAANDPARAPSKYAPDDCIKIAHVGSQDKPVGSLRMCIGEKGKSKPEWILANDWLFEFDPATYREIEAFVVRHRVQDPLGPGLIQFGTFSVTWGPSIQKNRYIVPSSSICRYFGELVRLAPKESYAAFMGVVKDLMARLRCDELSPGTK